MKYVGSAVSGLRHYQSLSKDESSVLVKAGKITLYALQFEAGAAEVQYLQCFDKATAAEVSGTMTPDFVIMVPASDGVFIPAMAPIHHFRNGLVIRCSKTNRDQATAPATAPLVGLWYAAD